jgi:hypothetical protein
MNCTKAFKWFKPFKPCAWRKSAEDAKLKLISLDNALSSRLKIIANAHGRKKLALEEIR